MFVRKVENRSGSVSVQVIRKDQGQYRVVRTFGTSKDSDEIDRLYHQAQHFLFNANPYQDKLFSMQSQTDQAVQRVMESLSNAHIHTAGPELIFGTLFDRIGFNQIPDELFRHLVIARLAYPTSKLKTIDYLYRYKGIRYSVSAVYKFLDRLHSRYKQQAEAIAYQHTQERLNTISVVFYDITTLYFEAEEEDELRKAGCSKDGKFHHPQMLVGLLVGEEGLPIGYDLFEGNTFEGHTLLPTLKSIQKTYGFKQLTVVADAAMLSKDNLAELESANHSFIIGARIKNESQDIKQEILEKANRMKTGEPLVLKRKDDTRLIVTYSEKRAYRDALNRKKGIQRLEKRMRSGRLTKQHINNRGYNKFLTLQGEVKICIDEDKIEQDQQWDGLKGYITNTGLNAEEVVNTYSHLWQIEKAFRISKTDLRVRPIHHYRKRRIEAHLCIAFVAYAIYKEVESLLARKKMTLSAQRAGELTHTMYELQYTLPDSNEKKTLLLQMDEEQQTLYNAVHEM